MTPDKEEGLGSDERALQSACSLHTDKARIAGSGVACCGFGFGTSFEGLELELCAGWYE